MDMFLTVAILRLVLILVRVRLVKPIKVEVIPFPTGVTEVTQAEDSASLMQHPVAAAAVAAAAAVQDSVSLPQRPQRWYARRRQAWQHREGVDLRFPPTDVTDVVAVAVVVVVARSTLVTEAPAAVVDPAFKLLSVLQLVLSLLAHASSVDGDPCVVLSITLQSERAWMKVPFSTGWSPMSLIIKMVILRTTSLEIALLFIRGQATRVRVDLPWVVLVVSHLPLPPPPALAAASALAAAGAPPPPPPATALVV